MHVGRLITGGAAALLVTGLGIAGMAPASAVDLGRVDFDCSTSADNIYGNLEIVGSTVVVNGEVGDTFTIDEDPSTDCPVLNYQGQSVNTLPELGGFVSYGSNDTLYENPLRYADSITVEFVINGPGTFRIQAPDLSYYTIVVNGGTPDASSAPAAIPDWVQAYARDGKDATCEDGWGPSWQKWAKDISDGWVCTRTIPSLG